MSQQLAAIRMAKVNNKSIEEAIKTTSKSSLEGKQPTTTMGKEINDPKLVNSASSAAVHLNPITGTESPKTETTNSNPSFGGFGWNMPKENGSDDLPF